MALTYVVVRGKPSNCTTDPLTKFDPLTVRVKVPPNASTGFGEMLEIDGTGLFTVRVSAAEAPPPGAELTTVIDRYPATATSDVGIAAFT